MFILFYAKAIKTCGLSYIMCPIKEDVPEEVLEEEEQVILEEAEKAVLEVEEVSAEKVLEEEELEFEGEDKTEDIKKGKEKDYGI